MLRHGDAEDGAPKADADRALTSKGERQAEAAGRALEALGVRLDLCLSSPKLRARRTAELACVKLAVPLELDERLRGGDFDPFELAAGRGEVLLVGHEPDFSRAIAIATGSRVKMKKGGVAAFDDQLLYALLGPKDLSAIGRA